jgi:hypothetical protein
MMNVPLSVASGKVIPIEMLPPQRRTLLPNA